MRTLETFAGDLYVGSPWLLSAAGPLGATGAILAVANVEPALSIAAFAGDTAAQRALAPARPRPAARPPSRPLLAERTGRSRTHTRRLTRRQSVVVSISWPRRARPSVSYSFGAAWMCWVGTWASRCRRCRMLVEYTLVPPASV